jgi:hypothetical protein
LQKYGKAKWENGEIQALWNHANVTTLEVNLVRQPCLPFVHTPQVTAMNLVVSINMRTISQHL